uniref:Ninjurin 1 n=1 Tax=Anolis carolinensis TaxID=28377 RepID=H9G4V3_ANOCA|nr:PREDICTED: ninjurin-1 [Anolis carolinensis]|eukprot:XP_008113797.1 PREDICTED: ninjurin-1 [Anolis carolinensis]
MDSATETHELNGLTAGSSNGDATPPAPDQPQRQWLQRNRPININHYANKKSAAESMLDIALLMANASQLKAVMEQGPSFSFYIPLIVLISISLTLQVGVGVLLIFLDCPQISQPGTLGCQGLNPHSALKTHWLTLGKSHSLNLRGR